MDPYQLMWICPLCGESESANRVMSHCEEVHGMADFPQHFADRYWWYSPCGKPFPGWAERLDHMNEHGKECLLIGMLLN